MPLNINDVILAVIIGTLAAIVYSLRILVSMERRIARIESAKISFIRRAIFQLRLDSRVVGSATKAVASWRIDPGRVETRLAKYATLSSHRVTLRLSIA